MHTNATTHRPECCIHQLVAAQAARTPEAVAVSSAEGQLTYAELELRANQLAHFLIDLGVGPERLVGVCLERGLNLVVSVLGVLKAGAAYVPLDPTYPTDRLAFMLGDSAAAVLLTQASLAGLLDADPASCTVVRVDADWPTIANQPECSPTTAVTADNLAYVIYTSGSTGRPKGVAIQHASTVVFLGWAIDFFGTEDLRAVLAGTSICFDLSVFELFAPLSSGGTVVLAENAFDLLQVGRQMPVTLVNTVPSAMWELVRAGGLPETVRTVNLAGEPLPNELAQAIYRLPGVTRVVNLYGPTEDTTYSTVAVVEKGSTEMPSIGAPIEASHVYLLDEHLREVSKGDVGELYIGGAGLARGYLNRPELTSQKFVPDPFAEGGARLYRTGDLARLRPDGCLEYLGRTDHQVKIRGFRIELGEIEHALRQDPAVEQALVVAHEYASHDKRLVAYVVPATGHDLEPAALRRAVSARLPGFMVPSAFLALERFPLTPNGKIDRAALPNPETLDGAADRDLTLPRTPLEAQLADIWTEVLRVPIGVDDDFFELGGDSILAIRIVARAAANGIEITPRQVFQHTTVAQLAHVATHLPESPLLAEIVTAPEKRREATDHYTTSDFPLARLDQRQLDRLVGSEHGIEDVYPLAPMQEGMLFHSLFAPEPGMYVSHSSFVIHAQLDLSAFTQAWQYVVNRHSILRTHFAWDGLPAPLQVVLSEVPLPIEHIDWRHLSTQAQNDRLAELMASDRHRGYDLVTAPLLRLYVLRLTDDLYHVVWSMHHAIMDGWSTPLIFDDLWAAYAALREQRELDLRPTRPYRDYIAWLQLQDASRSEHFWRDHLRGFSRPIRLGVDREIPQHERVEPYAQRQVALPQATREAADAFARAHRITLHTLLQGAWALLLGQHGATRDVVFGTVASGRPPTLAGVESIVGMFLNTLPARVSIRPSSDLLTWLKDIQQQQVEIRDHGHVALTQIQQWSDVPAGTPLFESILVFENYGAHHASETAAPGIIVHDGGSLDQTNYPLTVVVTPGSELSILASYRTDRFAAPAIERMLDHLVVLIERMIADPNHAVGSYTCLTAAERARILHEWNDTTFDYDRTLGIPERIAAWAERTPDAVAVTAGANRLTFAEFNRRAESLAARLRGLGVVEDTRVGICADRSTDMVVGLLAILKSGGAYVPMDPSYPPGRLRLMLDDARASILLTQRHLQARVPERATTLLIDDDADFERPSGPIRAVPAPSPASVAYVIYTSGSTGEPKGVEVSRGALINRVAWYADAYGVTPEDRASQFLSLAFDVCGWEIWPHLAAGASVHIVDESIRNSPRELQRWLVNQRITICNLPTSIAEAMLDLDWPTETALRCVQTGGEQLRRRPTPGLPFRLVNNYGPTENTVTSTCYSVLPADEAAEPIAIGRPIGNTRAYIVDAHLQLLPAGIPGELVLAGEGLANGYSNRPVLTAERFIPNPFDDERPGARVYRTGDLARYLPNGSIEFLGRLDHQLKIRGYRVEPGEIEAVLAKHPDLHEAAVMLREDEAGLQRLVGYVVPRTGRNPHLHDVHTFLKDQLPSYMIPQAFVVLDSLPLNGSGKVDHTRLPAPPAVQSDDTFVAPRTPLEETVATVWRNTLGLAQVGVHDNFFDLGGHSLLATRLMSQIHDVLQLDLPMRTLFEAPTVAGMAEAIERCAPPRREKGRTIPRRPPGDRAPLSFAQQRLWFLDQLEPGATTYVISDVFRLHGNLNIGLFERSLQALVDRHESLRTTFSVVDGKPIQMIAPALKLLLPRLDLHELPEVRREARLVALAREEAERPFDLVHGPLMRVTLVHLAEDEHALVLSMHHIVTDGWSMGIFVQELRALYTAFLQGAEAPSLAPQAVQYADFAAWQQEWLQSGVLDEQLLYWKRQLEGAPQVLDLPTDRPRSSARTNTAGTVAFDLSPEVAAALKSFSHQEGATLYMTLLSAFAVLLSRYTRQQDMLVATTIANRNRSELEDIVGFFVNTLVLRTDVAGNPSFRALVQRVRELCLDAYAHQDVPFERLVEELQPEREMSRTPLVQVMFSLQNAPKGGWDLPGVRVEPVELGFGSTPFDLAVELWEGVDGTACSFVYNRELFEHDTIARMADHYQHLLDSIVAGVDKRVDDLVLLTAPELAARAAWNETGAAYPVDRRVHELFEEQVAIAPEMAAIVAGNRQLTYRELNDQADQLAAYLRDHAVGPDVVVGVCMPRSQQAIVSMLGILKAGAAYLPLDPIYPQDRLVFMVEDARVPIILTEHELCPVFGSTSASIVCVDTDWPVIAQHTPRSQRVDASPDSLAYVIYTSGSTGKPKGVMIQHRSLTSYTRALNQRWELGPGDRVLAFASISFDMSVEEIFTTLTQGATLVLRSEDALDSMAEFLRACDDQSITLLDLPTAFWHELTHALAHDALTLPSSIRLTCIGGDKALPEQARAWLSHVSPRVCLLNTYGPTEATVAVTTHPVLQPAVDSPGWREVPIGTALPNVQLHVVDPSGQQAPVGVPGELLIGGVQVARGYLNRPSLTAERFVPDAFSGTPGARLYRTGDLVRLLANGVLEFIGRVDNQVKIRGFRIEIGEIEATIASYPGVRDVAVVAREETPGDRRLVAYVLADPEAVSARDVQTFLNDRLPAYMVPSAVLVLASVPLTPSGKIERRQLPAPARENDARTFTPPQTPTEHQLADIWRHVLGVEAIGRHDSFFELGGHSLLATRLVARIRESFQVDIPVRRVFETPRLAGLATAVDVHRSSTPSHMPSLTRRSREAYRVSAVVASKK